MMPLSELATWALCCKCHREHTLVLRIYHTTQSWNVLENTTRYKAETGYGQKPVKTQRFGPMRGRPSTSGRL